MKNCSSVKKIKDLCVCPKNLRGRECELEIPFKCKIKDLFVKNKTQNNKIDLLKNKNTFYYEYYTSPDIYCLFNENDDFNNNNYLDYNIYINCTDAEFYDYNYTITLGNLNENQIEININDFLFENSNYTNFDYFIEEKALTVGLPLEVYLRFKIYDMDSLMPYITLYFPFSDNSTLSKVKTNFKQTENVNSKSKIDSNLNIIGKTERYQYDLFILNSDTIRNFICENFSCEKNEKLESIIEKNYKNKDYYNNFSNNLMKYINRKNNLFNTNKNINKAGNDFDYSEYFLNDKIKFSKIKDEYMHFINENFEMDEKEKIKNLLTGNDRYLNILNMNNK